MNNTVPILEFACRYHNYILSIPHFKEICLFLQSQINMQGGPWGRNELLGPSYS